MQKQGREEKKLMSGVAILMPASLFTKIIGLFYKIPLIAIVGVEGMAYFLAAYHIYSLLFVLSATGLPSALSLCVARALAKGEKRAVRRIFSVSLWLFLTLGVCGTALLFFFAPALARRISMADAAAAIAAIAPSLFLAAFTGATKGYFQGFGQMLPTALSEVCEALGKLIFGLLFALKAKKAGLPTPTVAAYAIFGITVGMLLSALLLCAFLAVHFFRAKGKKERDAAKLPRRRALLCRLVALAFPTTVSASVMSLVSLADTAVISARLQSAGYAPAVANAMYSSYGNLAVPLYNLVPALLAPVTLSLMPLIAAAFSKRDLEGARKILRTAFSLVTLAALPASLGLSIFAAPILRFLYRGQSFAVSLAAPALSLLAPAVLPAVLIGVAGAALQASGRTGLPVAAMALGAGVKLSLEWILLPIDAVGLLAAPISTLCCNMTVLLVEGVALSRAMGGVTLLPKDLFRQLASAALSVAGGASFYYFVLRNARAQIWSLPLSLALCGVLFLFFACRTGAIGKEELLLLPAGEHVYATFQKIRLLK